MQRFRIPYIVSLCLILLGCQDTLWNQLSGSEGKTAVKLNLSLEKQIPVTRSTFSELDAVTINDVNILIYSNDGTQLNDLIYFHNLNYTSGSSTSLNLTFNTVLGLSRIYVVANWGTCLDELTVATDTQLKALKFSNAPANGIPTNNLPLFCAVGAADADIYTAGSTNIASGLSINAEMKRLVSRITVMVDDSKLSSGVSVIPTNITLRQVPTTVTLGRNAPSTGFVDTGDSHAITTAELPQILRSSIASSGTPAFNPHDPGGSGIALFMLENMQGEGVPTTDQKQKAPINGKSSLVTYLEVTAKYINTVGGYVSGTFKYRLYLGSDVYTNMDIQRNTHYLVTLNLKGDGGLVESSWRISKSDLSYWNTDAIAYVGYYPNNLGQVRIRFNSQAERDYAVSHQTVSATPSDYLSFTNNNTTISGTITTFALQADTSDPLYAILPFTTSGLANIYYEERKYATLTIKNSHSDYSDLTVSVIQGAMPKGVGIFRSEESNAVFHADASNLNLKSHGAWTVRVLSSSENWILLGSNTVDASTGNYVSSGILSQNKEITGGTSTTEEWVHFDFQPSGTVTTGTIRGGVIEILYNNNLSKHYVYVRQGYAPVRLNTSSNENAYWSSYNSYGRIGNPNSASKFMNSPLEVGYMFTIGSNIGINPYSPGWNGATINSISSSLPVSMSAGSNSISWSSFGTDPSDKWGKKKSEYPSPSGNQSDYQSPSNTQCQSDLAFDFNTTPTRGVFGRVYDEANNPHWGMLVRQMNGSSVDASGITVFFPTGGSRLGGSYDGALFYGGPDRRDNGNPRYGTYYIIQNPIGNNIYIIDVYSNYNNMLGIRVLSVSDVSNWIPAYWNIAYQARTVWKKTVGNETDLNYKNNVVSSGYITSDASTGYPQTD